MNNNLLEYILIHFQKKIKEQRWHRAVTFAAGLVVFFTAYALVLPAITMTRVHPVISADETETVSGEELSLRVEAEAPAGEEERIVVLTAEGGQADLSLSYVFDDEGICEIIDEEGQVIQLHRTKRTLSNSAGEEQYAVDYWFTLSAGTQTSFTLDLIDEAPGRSFAKIVETLRETAVETASAEETDSEENATASDAVRQEKQEISPGKASGSNAVKASGSRAVKASVSNAEKASGSNAVKASVSNAEEAAAEANAIAAASGEETITLVEAYDDGFVELLDGQVVNDVNPGVLQDEDENDEVSARLRLAIGSGLSYDEAVRDFQKNAEKRGDAVLRFTWTKPAEALRSELVKRVDDAVIAVICPDDTELPAGAWVDAFEILPGTLEYQQYVDQAGAAVAENEGVQKVVTRARFFDITIRDAEGNEIQPDGEVKVVISYDKPETMKSAADAADSNEDLNVVHFSEGTADVLDADEEESGEASEVVLFEADSFSVYGFVYTVDSPFETEEALTVSLMNERQIPLMAAGTPESFSLDDFVKNAVISGAVRNDAGQYVVEEGKEYSITITFSEDPEHQFQNDQDLVYQMPAGITILTPVEDSGYVNIVYKSKTYRVKYDYTLDESGKLTIRFDQNDPEYHKLENSTNVSIRFTYKGLFNHQERVIEFSEDLKREIVFEGPRPGQAYVKKDAVYDEHTGIFHYTVTVTADGNVENVNVKDVITGNALSFNNDVHVSGNSGSYTDKGAANGFDYTFSSMQDGEVITITYSAHTDFSKDIDKDGRITVDQTRNTVTVQPDGGDPHHSDYAREITYKWTDKSDGTEAGTVEGNKIIQWSISYNELALVSAAGDTITDTISSSSQRFMKYYGDGIIVKVRNHDGELVETREISYRDLAAFSDSSWTYTIPTADTVPYSYEITYYTVVNMAEVNSTGVLVPLSNAANGNYGGINVAPENSSLVILKKTAESYTTEEINWSATLEIPEGGLSEAKLIDYFPHIWLNDENRFDLYKNGTLQVTGLLEGECYTCNYYTNCLEIEFFKDPDKNEHGLLPDSGGRRVITVKLTTKVDQDWLKKGFETGDYEQKHTNTITLNNSLTATATVIFDEPVMKTGQYLGNGSFLYTVLLSGVSDAPLIIKDTFNTSLLEVDTSRENDGFYGEHMKICGGIIKDSQTFGRTSITYTDSPDGMILTADPVPMQADGTYYPYYKITYYLKLKEGVDLEQLAIANGGEFHLKNTAAWGNHKSSFDYEVKYEYLDKELLNEGELGGVNRMAKYKITFNSAKGVLNNNEPMKMTDVLSANLSVRYESVQIVTDPEGLDVPYTLSGGDGGTTVAEFLVPDAAKVEITYEAQVIGNGKQSIENKVSVKGREKTVTTEELNYTPTEGTATLASFTIVKVDAYDAGKKLSGVKFRVFPEDPKYDFGEGRKEIILETDKDGVIRLDGEEYDLYFGKKYHVQEIDPPENYGLIDFDYEVTLNNEMDLVDYEHFNYYYNDSMQIKNWPLEGLVIEKRVDSPDEEDVNRYYNFRISILKDDGSVDTDYNEANGDDKFTGGISEFRLKDRQQKMFRGFPKGTKYKVEEILDESSNGMETSVTYSIYDDDGNVADTETVSGTDHIGELTQEDELILFTNSRSRTGSIKVEKTVTYNGQGGETAALKHEKLAGTYKFTLYEDAELQNKYQKNGENVVVELTVQDDCSPVTSEEIGDLPAGTYYLYEELPAGSEAVPVMNPVPVEVKAGMTGDAAVIAKFRNNYTDEPDETFLTIRKTFAGITRDKIPSGFRITVTSTDGEVEKTLDSSTEGLSIHEDGLVWSWKLTDIPADKTYIITETEETDSERVNTAEIPGYKLYAEGFDVSRTVNAPENTIQEIVKEAPCSTEIWPVGEHQDGHFLFAASLTNQKTLIVTKEQLSEGQRKWVEETLCPALAEADPDVWTEEIIYYSAEEHPNGFTIPGGENGEDKNVFYRESTQSIELEKPELWQHAAKVNYTCVQDHAEFETENSYQELTEFEFRKVWQNAGKDIEWPAEVESITVTLKRTAEGTESGQDTEETAVFKVTKEGIEKTEGFNASAEKLERDGYRHKVTGIDKYSENGTEWIYAISETPVEGFNLPAYYTVNQDGAEEEQRYSNDSTGSGTFIRPGETGGVKIVNDTVIYVMPSTGGPGTLRLSLAGILLFAFGAMLYGFELKRGHNRQ
ncbi:MAG: hypothetical protein IJT43_12645 [Stomatobaculum sp.]|nr:hypothetical protein [Stomatobaculum sp.]